MSDYDDLPDLPSDEELGITEEDIRAAEEEGRAPTPPETGKKPPAAATPPPAEKEPPPAPPPGPTETPPAPAGGFRGPLTLLVLLALTLVSTQWWALPAPVPANAPDTAFSSARAMAQLVEIASEAHPPGSPEHDRVRAFILDELADLGLDPQVQTTTSMIRGNDVLRTATVRNVLARIPGTASTGTLVLTAHYDGRELSRAAADDGFGVVSILETVRALREGPPHRNDILVLITDAEELGLLGARAFVAEHPLMEDAAVALSVEMRGGGGASIMFETGAQNGWIVRHYAENAPVPFGNSLGYEVYRRMPNDTDFTPLKQAGLQGLNFAGIGRAHLYHQAYDAPENVSEATLQHHGLQLLSMARVLAGEDLGNVEAPDVTYFTVPFVGMVVYGEQVTWAVSAGLVLLFALVLLLVRSRGGSWGGMVAGLGIAGLVSLASWGLGTWLVGWLSGFHPEQEALHGSAFHTEGWYVLALAAAVFVLTTVLFFLARRRFSLGALALGAALVPFLAALAATFMAPMAAMDLQWPAAATLLATAAVAGVPPRARAGWVGWGVALLLAAPVLVLLVPLTELLWLAVSFTAAPLLAVLLAVVLALLLPALDALREPNPWWAPALGLVAFGAFVGVGILLSDPTPDRPLHTTLAYTFDRDTGEAFWLTQPLHDGVREPTDDPARSWAVGKAGSAFARSWTEPLFLQAAPVLPATPAEPVEAAQPQLAVARDTVLDGERLVRLALRSAIGAEMVLMELPPSAEVVRVNGHPVPETTRGGDAPERITRLSHWGRPEDALLVDLRVDSAATTLSLGVVEHLLRPEEILGEEPWRRPPHMAPNIVRNSDRAMIRTPLSVALVRGAVAVPAAPAVEGGREAPPAGAPDTAPAASDTGTAAPDTGAAAPPDTTGGTGAGVREPAPAGS